MKKFWKSLDYPQLLAVCALLAFGLVFIYSTGQEVDTETSRGFFFKQIQWIAGGAVLYFLLAASDYRSPLQRGGLIAAFAVTVLLLTAVPFIGVRIYGARRWLNIFGFRLQPAEPVKVLLVYVLSVIFANGFSWRKVPLSLAALGVPFLLICIQPDLGSALVLLPIYFAVLFVSGLKWRVVLAVLLLAAGLLALVAVDSVVREEPLILRNYQRDRIRVFLNPGIDRSNRGHNAYQARLAVGAGGWSGNGIGQGTQNELGFLPQTVANNDFIFSVIAEELGFTGALTLLGLYTWLLYTLLRTAFLADAAGRALTVGIAVMLFAHIFINIGMSVGVAPVTGLPLPLVSYGGSFTLTGLAALGLAQSVYRHREPDNLAL